MQERNKNNRMWKMFLPSECQI